MWHKTTGLSGTTFRFYCLEYLVRYPWMVFVTYNLCFMRIYSRIYNSVYLIRYRWIVYVRENYSVYNVLLPEFIAQSIWVVLLRRILWRTTTVFWRATSRIYCSEYVVHLSWMFDVKLKFWDELLTEFIAQNILFVYFGRFVWRTITVLWGATSRLYCSEYLVHLP